MKIEQHINGALQLILIPDTDLERAFVAAMHESTKLGKKVIMSLDMDATGVKVSRATVSVEV